MSAADRCPKEKWAATRHTCTKFSATCHEAHLRCSAASVSGSQPVPGSKPEPALDSVPRLGPDCEMCLNGLTQWEDENSKKHLKNTQKEEEWPIRGAIYCPDCETWLNGQTQWEVHKLQKKHRFLAEWQKIEIQPADIEFQAEEEQEEDEGGWHQVYGVYGLLPSRRSLRDQALTKPAAAKLRGA